MGNNKHLSMKFVFSSLCIFLALSCITPGTSGATECFSGVLTFTELANAEAYNANTKKMYELGFAHAYTFTTEEGNMFKLANGVTICSKAASRRGLAVTFTACKGDTFTGADPTGTPSMEATATAFNAVIAKNGDGLGVVNAQSTQITGSEAPADTNVCPAGADAGAGADDGAGAGADDGAGAGAGAGADDGAGAGAGAGAGNDAGAGAGNDAGAGAGND